MTKRNWSAMLLAAALVLTAQTAVAQTTSASADTLYLSIDEALSIGLEQNHAVRMADQEAKAAESRFKQANAVFFPSVTIEENAMYTTDPINAFGFKLKQERISQPDFNPAVLNDPDAIENFNTRIAIEQPLLNFDGFLERSAASLISESARKQLQGTKNYAAYQIKQAYFMYLLSDKKIDVLERSLRSVESFEKRAEDYYKQEIINKADLLGARVQKLTIQQELEKALNDRDTAEDQLRFLLNVEQTQPVKITSNLEKASFVVKPGMIAANPMNSRLEAIDLRVQAAQKMEKASKYAFLPRLNLFGSYDYNDQDLFAFDASSYTVGASLQWNLFNGFKNIGKMSESQANLKKARIMYEQESVQNEMKVKKARRAIEEARQNITLTEAATEQAEEDYRIRSDRFDEGLEQSSDVLQAEAKRMEARLRNLQAVFQFNMGVATLELLYETDFN